MPTSVNVNGLSSPDRRTRVFAERGTRADMPHITARGLSALIRNIGADGMGEGLLVAVFSAVGLVCSLIVGIYLSSLVS